MLFFPNFSGQMTVMSIMSLWISYNKFKYKQRHFGLAGTQTSYFNIHPDHFFEELQIVVYHSFKNQTGSAGLTKNRAPIWFDYTEKPKILFFFKWTKPMTEGSTGETGWTGFVELEGLCQK